MGRKYNKMKRLVQINDLHVPFQDVQSLNAVYEFLEDFKPHQIVIAGDMLDFYELSRFDKNPARKYTIQDELNQCGDIINILRSFCDELHFIKGNHEDRLRRFLWQNPSLASLKVLELPNLLGLQPQEYHDFEYIYNDFRFTHGTIVRQESGQTAKGELMKYGSSMASGHTHRLGMYMKTDARGTVAAYEMGCLCDTNPEYINGIPNWVQGLGVYFFDDNHFHCEQLPILKHKFIYGGKIYGNN